MSFFSFSAFWEPFLGLLTLIYAEWANKRCNAKGGSWRYLAATSRLFCYQASGGESPNRRVTLIQNAASIVVDVVDYVFVANLQQKTACHCHVLNVVCTFQAHAFRILK